MRSGVVVRTKSSVFDAVGDSLVGSETTWVSEKVEHMSKNPCDSVENGANVGGLVFHVILG